MSMNEILEGFGHPLPLYRVFFNNNNLNSSVNSQLSSYVILLSMTPEISAE